MKEKVARLKEPQPVCTCGACKGCKNRAFVRAWKKRNKGKVAVYGQGHYSRHKEEVLARSRTDYYTNREKRLKRKAAWKKANPRAHRSGVLRRAFGISLEDYEAMLEKQKGVCAICKQPERKIDKRRPEKVVSLSVDHCHRTKKVRGLLCYTCNNGLGLFKDSPELLGNAIMYLQQKDKQLPLF